MIHYLETPIVEVKHTKTPRWGVRVDGYTKRSGAATSLLVRLQGEKRWRRLMIWQFSNMGTQFLRIMGTPHIVRDIGAAVQ